VSRSPAAVLAVILLLAAAAVGALAVGSRPRDGAAAREFHGLTGGLGFGPALDPSRCAFGFDPRLCPACESDVGPVPGGAAFCPFHAGAVFDYPPAAGRGGGDARLP
jgi:hypothetical protein